MEWVPQESPVTGREARVALEPGERTEVEELRVRAGALSVRLLASGPHEGPLVLLLHGFPERAESWLEVLPRLGGAGFRAVAPDLRGYAGTDRPTGGYDLETLVEDAVALIRSQGRERVHVVGHDWGGAIAYHLAATRPERVRSLAVVNCPHPAVLARRMWRPGQLRRSWYMFFFQLPWLPERVLTLRRGSLVPRLIRAAAVDRSRFTDARLAPYAEAFSDVDAGRAALAYYRSAFRALLRPDFRERMREYPVIVAPFRLLWGTEDVALGLELTRDLQRWFARPVEVSYLEGVGHFAPLEAPGRVAELLLEHLRAER